MMLDRMLFVGFNRRVAAIDKEMGSIIWEWKAPDGTGFVSLLLDGHRLMVAVNGYLHCLDARTGASLWRNPMRGFGYGVTSLVTSHSSTHHSHLGEAGAQAAAAASSGAAGGTSGNGGDGGGGD